MAQPFTLELLDGPKWIIDPPFDPYGDGCVQRARVEIRADGLAAHIIATLDSTAPQTLAEFFGQLDADWRGWDGERHWSALEGMAIEASHGGGHVVITVTIEPPPVPSAKADVWSARAVFTLEAGEQLRTVARDLASLLAE